MVSFAPDRPVARRAIATLVELVDGLAGFAGRPALVAFADRGRREWTYEALARSVGELAGGLVAAGIAPGDHVALFAADRPEWIIAALAVVRAGGVVVPLDAQFGDDTLAHVLADSAARLIVTDAERASRVARLAPGARVVRLDAPAGDPASRDSLRARADRLPGRDPDDPAALFYTSGTTGRPKGVPLTHRNLAFQVATLEAMRLVTPRDRVCLPLPLHHVYPFVLGLLTPLALGLPIVLPAALTGPQLLRAVDEGEVTVLVGVPRLHAALLAAIEAQLARRPAPVASAVRLAIRLSAWMRRRLGLGWGAVLLRPVRARVGARLRLLTSGGAALDPQVARTLVALGWQLATGYGLTETSPLLAMNLPDSPRPDSAGRPVPGVTLRIAPPAGAGPGEGEIQARSPGIFGGYLNLPEKTREAFTPDGWFRTGDLGRLDEAGFLHVTGRVDEMLVTEGGENVQPEDVERAFQRHAFLRDFAVLQHEGRLVGLALPDLARIEAAGRTDVAGAVREAVAEVNARLPSYQRVTDVSVTREPLPRTRLGKLRRPALPDAYRRARADGGAAAPGGPVSPEEMAEADRRLLDHPAARRVWAWLARRYPDRRLAPDASLGLDLGIDSLGWLELTLEIEREAGVALDQAALARIATVRDLLREVAAAPETGGAPPTAWWEEPERLLSPAQARTLEPLGPGLAVLARALWAVNAGLVRALFGLRVRGVEHLPGGSWVLVANHASYLDPLALAAALGPRRLARAHWGGWTGIVSANRLMRALSRLWRVLPIEPRRGAASSLALAAAVLTRGGCLVWFPEGRRSPSGALLPFRPGIGLLLAHVPHPVVPAHLAGTHAALPPGRFWPRRRRITVTFGPPVDPRALVPPDAAPEEAARRIADGLRAAVADLERAAGPTGGPTGGRGGRPRLRLRSRGA